MVCRCTAYVTALDGYVGIELDFFAQAFNEEGMVPDENIPPKDIPCGLAPMAKKLFD